MSERKTCAPSRAKASAIAWPMPSAAPVTTATFLSSRPMFPPLRRPSALELVEGDGDDDDGAGDHQLPLGLQVEHAKAVRQKLQDEDAERHAEKRADPAGQADAAQHHRGNHLELETEAGEVHRRAEARGEENAGDRGKERADDEAGELDPADAIAGEARHFGIAADRIHLPPEGPVAHYVHEGEEEHEGDHRGIGDDAEVAEPVDWLRQNVQVDGELLELMVAERKKAVEASVVGDRHLAGVKIDAATKDEQRAEGDDERV